MISYQKATKECRKNKGLSRSCASLVALAILALKASIFSGEAMEQSMQCCFTYKTAVFSNIMRQKGLDRLANCPKPALKTYEQLNAQTKFRVIPLISDEFKITPKKKNTFIYVPSVKFGTVLTIITENLVAVGYFGDDCKTKAPLFLESILSNDSNIQSVSLMSPYYAPSVQTIHDLLDEQGIKQRTYCDIFPAIFEGDINEKGEMTGRSILKISNESLGYASSDHVNHNYDEAIERLSQKRSAPLKVAIDCFDGQFIDLYKSVKVQCNLSIPIQMTALPLSFMNVEAMAFYLDEKKVSKDELSKLIDDLDLLNM